MRRLPGGEAANEVSAAFRACCARGNGVWPFCGGAARYALAGVQGDGFSKLNPYIKWAR